MELIPILSTIILVATISTFLLAIGAYVLYKVREKKGQQMVAAPPATVSAELVTPQRIEEKVKPQPEYAEPRPVPSGYSVPQPVYMAQPASPKITAQPVYPSRSSEYDRRRTRESKFLKYTTEGYVSAKEDKNVGTLKWR